MILIVIFFSEDPSENHTDEIYQLQKDLLDFTVYCGTDHANRWQNPDAGD